MNFIKFFTGFVQEDDGSSSVMRLGFLIVTCGMVGLSFYIECCGEWNVYNAGLVSGTITGIGVSKAWQRKHESKEYIEDTKAAASKL